jgi:phosphoglucosamine mutase
MEVLQEKKWQLGGENSGHIICLDKHSTGDGIVSALQVLCALRMKKQTLAEAAGDLHMYPQVLINVKVTGKAAELLEKPAVKAAVLEVERALNGKGRVLLRPSGTEPLLRVMVEGEDGVLVKQSAERIAVVVKEVAG